MTESVSDDKRLSAASSSATHTNRQQHANGDADVEKGASPVGGRTEYEQRRRPWRRHVTPWERIAGHEYMGKGTEEDPCVISWLKDDPENPQTWSTSEQWLVTATVAFTTFAVSFASSTYSGAISQVRHDFPGYSDQVYIMGVSNFVLGFAFGPLIWAPLSELFGRRNMFIVSYIGFSLFSGGVVASQNIWTIDVLRFFAGFFGSSPLTNSGGTIGDMFSPEKRGLGMSVFASAPFIGPAIGPIVGGFLGEAGGWRWVCGLIAILATVLLTFGFFFIPETYAPVLLHDRAERLTVATGKVHRSVFEKEGKKEFRVLLRTAMIRPWLLLAREPIVLLLAMYAAIIYGVLYLLFAAFPIVFQQQRGWSPGVGGLAFSGLLIGLMGALAWMIFIENPRYLRVSKAHKGFAPPESRLVPACIGAVCLPISMFWFAWTAYPPSIHWIVPIIASVPFGFGLCLVFLSIMTYLIDSYLIFAVSALAANAVLRALLGFAFPLFATDMYRSLGTNWASSIPAFLALACVWMPFAFYKYGHIVRRKCKFSAEAAELWERMKATTEGKKVEVTEEDQKKSVIGEEELEGKLMSGVEGEPDARRTERDAARLGEGMPEVPAKMDGKTGQV